MQFLAGYSKGIREIFKLVTQAAVKADSPLALLELAALGNAKPSILSVPLDPDLVLSGFVCYSTLIQNHIASSETRRALLQQKTSTHAN